jgi:hypothetical protein
MADPARDTIRVNRQLLAEARLTVDDGWITVLEGRASANMRGERL